MQEQNKSHVKTHRLYGLTITAQNEEEEKKREDWIKRIKNMTTTFLNTANKYNDFYITTFTRIDYKRFLFCNISNPNVLWRNKIQIYRINWGIYVAGLGKENKYIIQNIDAKSLPDFNDYYEYTMHDNFKDMVQKKAECITPLGRLALEKFVLRTHNIDKDKSYKLLEYTENLMTLKHEYTEEDIEKDFYIR